MERNTDFIPAPEQEKKLPAGQIREHDTFFGQKIVPEPDKSKPNVALNCCLMILPLFLTVTSTFMTGLPLAMFVVIPGTLGGLVGWIIHSQPATKQICRSVFIGCFASWFFIGVLAAQWP